MADDEIVVVFDDAADGETVVKTGDATPPKETDPDLVSDLKSQLSNMRSQLSSESMRATTAEQIAQRVQTEARQQVNESRADTLESGILAAKADGDRAEQAYKAAFESGDADAMAKAQRALSGAEARRIHLENAKANLDELPNRRTVRTEDPAPRQQVPSDPFEAWAQGRSAPTVAWARQHKELVVDPAKFKRVLAAHYDAEAEGIEADTPEYFKHIEQKVGVTAPDTGRKAAGDGRRPSPTVLPADGGAAGGGGGPRQVKLTKGERESATDGTLTWNYDDPAGKFKKGEPIGIQEMARRKITMTEQGLYDKSYTVS